MTQIAADALGVPVSRVTVRLHREQQSGRVHVPTNADVGAMDISWMEEDDQHVCKRHR